MPRTSMGGAQPNCIFVIFAAVIVLIGGSFVYQGAISSNYGLITGGILMVAITLVILGRGWVSFKL